jgi:hypothetical protein
MSERRMRDFSIKFDGFEEVSAVIDDLVYDGLNLEMIRREFNKEGRSDKDVVDDVIACLISYMMVGNNTEKLTGKVTDQRTGMKMKNRLKTIGIKSSPETNTDITLPRSALAFLPPYYLLRLLFEDKLQNQTSSVIPIRYKDLAFSGVPEIWNMNGYQMFHKEYNDLIDTNMKKKSNRVRDDNTKETEREQWVTIAQNGYSADVVVKEFMENTLKMNPEEVEFNHVREGIIQIIRIYDNEFYPYEEVGNPLETRGPLSKRMRMNSTDIEVDEEGEIED